LKTVCFQAFLFEISNKKRSAMDATDA
jgi:hypothetical protein